MPADPRTTSVSGTGSPPGSSGAGHPCGVAPPGQQGHRHGHVVGAAEQPQRRGVTRQTEVEGRVDLVRCAGDQPATYGLGDGPLLRSEVPREPHLRQGERDAPDALVEAVALLGHRRQSRRAVRRGRDRDPRPVVAAHLPERPGESRLAGLPVAVRTAAAVHPQHPRPPVDHHAAECEGREHGSQPREPAPPPTPSAQRATCSRRIAPTTRRRSRPSSGPSSSTSTSASTGSTCSPRSSRRPWRSGSCTPTAPRT